jgi:hypothetical protein
VDTRNLLQRGRAVEQVYVAGECTHLHGRVRRQQRLGVGGCLHIEHEDAAVVIVPFQRTGKDQIAAAGQAVDVGLVTYSCSSGMFCRNVPFGAMNMKADIIRCMSRVFSGTVPVSNTALTLFRMSAQLVQTESAVFC